MICSERSCTAFRSVINTWNLASIPRSTAVVPPEIAQTIPSKIISPITTTPPDPEGPQHSYSVRAYDAFIAVAAAMEKCPEKTKTGNCLRENLNTMAALKGLGGTVKFDKYGDVTPTFSAYQVKDGRYVSLN